MKQKLVLFVSVLSITFGSSTVALGQWVQINNELVEVSCLFAYGPNLFASTYSGLFRSTDNGSNWKEADSGLTTVHVGDLIAFGSNLLVGTGGGGVFRSTDSGISWTSASSGFPIYSDVGSFALNGTSLFASADGVVYVTSDTGTSWRLIGSPSHVMELLMSGTNLIAAAWAGIFLSTDSGADWQQVDMNNYVTGLARSGANLFAGTSGGVFRSPDNGKSWQLVNTGLPQDTNVLGFIVSGSNLFAGSQAGVYLTRDNGSIWEPVNTGLDYPVIGCFAVIGSYLYAGMGTPGTNGGLWRRPLAEMINQVEAATDTQSVLFNDTGTVNLSLTCDSDYYRIHRIDFVNNSSHTLVITNAALTTSNNHFWISQLWPGVPDSVLPGDTFSIIVNFYGDTSGTIYLDTIMLSIGDPTYFHVLLKGYSYSSSTSGVSLNSDIALGDFRSFPNPLSQTTTICFSSPESGVAEISVVNLLGQEVARLFTGELEAGEPSFTWDASGATPGTYWCLLRAGGRVERIALSVLR